MRRPRKLSLVVMTITVIAIAACQTPEERQAQCRDADPSRAIAACNAIIQSGAAETADLADAFYSRGRAYGNLANETNGEHDRAIADYDAALQINPKLAEALYGRGLAKRLQGDAACAEADIGAAKSIEPEIAKEYERLGLPSL